MTYSARAWGRVRSHGSRTNADGDTKHTRETAGRYRSCDGTPPEMRRRPPYHSLQCLHLPPDASFIAHLSHANRQPHGTASKVTGLPHLQVVTSACSALTTAVAMPPPPAQQMHHPQEPSCNSYGSSTDLPPTRAVLRGAQPSSLGSPEGEDAVDWLLASWARFSIIDGFLCSRKHRGVLAGVLDESSAQSSRPEFGENGTEGRGCAREIHPARRPRDGGLA